MQDELETRRLRHFAETARFMSFRKAALHLGIAQSALSRHVQALESALGVVLFQRHANGIKLTEAGVVLLEHAQRILDLLGETQGLLDDMRLRPKGVVTFAVPASFADSYLAKIFGIFAADFPEVHLRVMIAATQNIENWLLDRQADIGIVVAPARSSSLIQENILTEDMYLVGRERLSWMGDGAVPLAVLRDLPLVLPLASYGSRRLIDIATSSLGFTLEPQIEIDGPHIMTELVRSRGLYTVMPKSVLKPGRDDDLVAIPLTPTFSRDLAVATLAGEPLSLATRAFAKVLRDVAR